MASDVAARGLDILNVDHVIHYQVPQNADVSIESRRAGKPILNPKMKLVINKNFYQILQI